PAPTRRRSRITRRDRDGLLNVLPSASRASLSETREERPDLVGGEAGGVMPTGELTPDDGVVGIAALVSNAAVRTDWIARIRAAVARPELIARILPRIDIDDLIVRPVGPEVCN